MQRNRSLAVIGLLNVLLSSGALLPRQAAADPDNTNGMAMLSAMVGSGGNLEGGAGAILTAFIETGLYLVRFDRVVRSCYYVPTPSSRDFSFTAGSASISAGPGDNQVSVRVFDTNGTPADIAFHLLVFCNQ